MIETLPVIHIFYQVIKELTFFSSKVADRNCHSKVIFGNFGTSLREYLVKDYCPVGLSTKTSLAS